MFAELALSSLCSVQRTDLTIPLPADGSPASSRPRPMPNPWLRGKAKHLQRSQANSWVTAGARWLSREILYKSALSLSCVFTQQRRGATRNDLLCGCSLRREDIIMNTQTDGHRTREQMFRTPRPCPRKTNSAGRRVSSCFSISHRG